MPRIPNKPSFPNVATEELKKSLDKVRQAVTDSTGADGKVSLDEVAEKLQGDAVAEKALDVVRGDDAFVRTETRTSVGCGGGRETREVRVPPKMLEGAEVQSALSALIAARTAVDAKDRDSDGLLSKTEIETSRGDSLAENIADRTSGLSTAAFKGEMDTWARELRSAQSSVESRQRVDRKIHQAAGDHAETALGKEAVVWGFRELVAKGSLYGDASSLDEKLTAAETSWLRFLPLFNATGPGHLSDQEIRGLFGTSDLNAFIAEKKASVGQLVGGDYEGRYLAGKNIEGLDQVNDPDFKKHTDSWRGGC